MTDQSPSPLQDFSADPSEAGHAMLPTLSLPAVSIPVVSVLRITVSKRVRGGAAERLNRSALWFAATGRWMNRSFDPAGSEAIRESCRTLPAAAGEDDEP
ncbi:hypothetical protein [Hypericibacter sp.]|uniref:hypothetical protein n=1 Tax=Hypericibacter sp. TaxID=2705401 RepID=UPI003D6DA58E